MLSANEKNPDHLQTWFRVKHRRKTGLLFIVLALWLISGSVITVQWLVLTRQVSLNFLIGMAHWWHYCMLALIFLINSAYFVLQTKLFITALPETEAAGVFPDTVFRTLILKYSRKYLIIESVPLFLPLYFAVVATAMLPWLAVESNYWQLLIPCLFSAFLWLVISAWMLPIVIFRLAAKTAAFGVVVTIMVLTACQVACYSLAMLHYRQSAGSWMWGAQSLYQSCMWLYLIAQFILLLVLRILDGATSPTGFIHQLSVLNDKRLSAQ
ncbi:hypothetical protein KDL44_09665 [bacterium]|nr:hypothetical protein [bacterium]